MVSAAAWSEQLKRARQARRLSQAEVAEAAGLSRMTVQKLEAGSVDARLSTLVELVRALGLELTLVPRELTPAVETFVRAGGRVVGQPSGIDAPPSIVDALSRETSEPAGPRGGRRR